MPLYIRGGKVGSPIDTVAPGAPGPVTFDSYTTTTTTVRFPASAAGDHASWTLRIASAEQYPFFAEVASGITAATYQVTGLTSGTLYYYYLVDVDLAGNASVPGTEASQATEAAGTLYDVFPLAAPTSIFTNDTGLANPSAQWRVTTQSPLDGAFSDFRAGGGFTYTAGNQNGDATFGYEILDFNGLGANTSAVVTVRVTGNGLLTNATRINTLLNGRSPHFTLNYPADPVTSGEPVAVTTFAGLQAAVALSGRIIQVGAGLTLTGTGQELNITGSDLDIIVPNSTTITGAMLWWGDGFNTPRTARVRWTGGNLVDGGMGVHAVNDLLVDDFNVNNLASVSSENIHNMGGISGAVPAGTRRMAFINSTIRLRGSNPAGGWAWFYHTGAGGPGVDAVDLLLGNVKLISEGGQNNRFIGATRLAIVDSVMNPDGLSGNGFRIHDGSTDVWIKDTWSREIFKVDPLSGSAPQVLNALFDNLDRYDTSYTWSNAAANTGEIRNSTLFGGTFSAAPFTDGSGNASETWDGSTVPDHSTVGAIR